MVDREPHCWKSLDRSRHASADDRLDFFDVDLPVVAGNAIQNLDRSSVVQGHGSGVHVDMALLFQLFGGGIHLFPVLIHETGKFQTDAKSERCWAQITKGPASCVSLIRPSVDWGAGCFSRTGAFLALGMENLGVL